MSVGLCSKVRLLPIMSPRYLKLTVSTVFKVYRLYGFVVIDDGVVGLLRAKNNLFSFTDIEFEVFFSTPLSEMEDCVEVYLG